MKNKDNYQINQIPCIVDRGVIFNKKDITRILQGLDQIEYTEFIDGKPHITRTGFIVEIFEDDQEATVFFNRRIHINVNSLEYIKVNYDFSAETKETEEKPKTNAYDMELSFGEGRLIRVKPCTDPIDNPTSMMEEVEERRRAMTAWEEATVDVEED
jgi:hypothetical protein